MNKAGLKYDISHKIQDVAWLDTFTLCKTGSASQDVQVDGFNTILATQLEFASLTT